MKKETVEQVVSRLSLDTKTKLVKRVMDVLAKEYGEALYENPDGKDFMIEPGKPWHIYIIPPEGLEESE